jgi:hypothetical protein
MLVVAFTWTGTVDCVSSFFRGTEESVLPMIAKVGGSEVNRIKSSAQRDVGA